MIYTVTLNPAIDYVMPIEALCPGQILRSAGEKLFFGGKGINVSLVLKALGVSSTATGFVAGFTGKALAAGIADEGIMADFVPLAQGFTRINVKLRAAKEPAETDINAQGPAVPPEAVEALLCKLDGLQAGDTLVLAGSIPGTLPSNIYSRMMERLGSRGVDFVVDAQGELLRRVLSYKPFLIKPNAQELGELFGVIVTTPEETIPYGEQLQAMGARNVLISLGEQGAVLLDETGTWHRQSALQGQARNTVGAGDSMLAGFLAGYQEHGDFAYALRLGTAAGCATAFCDGLADAEAIDACLAQLN